MKPDGAEKPPGGHAETANREPQTNKALLQRSFTLQPLLATSEQDAAHTATHHQAINQSLYKMHQQPATQQVKEKRVARAQAHEAQTVIFDSLV